jgi:hypothetical protein
MPLQWHGTNILTLAEWHTSARNTNMHQIGNKILLSGEPLASRNYKPSANASGYLYSTEMRTITGLWLGGTQVVLQKPGCRPRSITKQYSATSTSSTDLTYYIHRYPDGNVYVTGSSAHDGSASSNQVGYALASATFPRGVRYVIVQLVGGGGGGYRSPISGTNKGFGGGSGAAAVCCIRLPEDGYATIVAGGWGAGAAVLAANGLSGNSSSVACGSFTCAAGGGAGTSFDPGFGGTVTSSGNNADGYLIASVAGNNGSGVTGGAAASLAYTDYCPEGGSCTLPSCGEGGGGGSLTVSAKDGGGGYAALYY